MGGAGRVGDTDGVNSNDAPETKTTDALGGAGAGGDGGEDGGGAVPHVPGAASTPDPARTPGAAAGTEAPGRVVNAPEAVGGAAASASTAAEAGSTTAGVRDVSGAVGATRAGVAASAPEEVRAGDSERVATPAGTADATTPTRRLFWSTLGVAVVLLLGDQVSKWWAVDALGDSRSIDVIGDFIRFWLVYNPGAAFSLGTGVTWIFTVFAGVAVVAIAWYAWRVRSAPWAYALGLLLGGATSHFGDRLFREPSFGRGHVVDFIDYGGFFVGNVADIGIFAGAVTIVVLSFKGIEAVDPARPAEATEDVAEPAE